MPASSMMYLYFLLATMTLVAPFQRPNQIRSRKTSAIDHLNDLDVHAKSNEQSIRPILTAATIFVVSSMPMSTPAYTFDTSNKLVIPSSVTKQQYPTYDIITYSSTMQLSSSTIANPIGELEDGSKSNSGASFGQWFFLLYVVVSLLAGGKEMLGRIQKQMDKDDS